MPSPSPNPRPNPIQVETLQHDDDYMYSGSQDMSIRKWRRSDLHCAATLRGHEKGVLSLKLLGDMLYAG